MSKPKLNLVGEDGNAFAILGRAVKAANQAGWSKEKIAEYQESAMSGDYNNLIVVTMNHFNVDFGYEDIDNEANDR